MMINTVLNFATGQLWSVDAVADWSVQTGLAVTGLCLFILIIRRPFARLFGAPAAYMLWILPVLRLCLPAIAVPWLPRNMNLPPPQSVGHYALQSLPVEPVMTQTAAINWAVVMLTLWLIGAVIWGGVQILRQGAYHRRIAKVSTLPDAQITALASRVAMDIGVKRNITIRMMEGEGPCIIGLFKPVIILPCDFQARLSVDQRYMALLHELMHLRRHDLLGQAVAMTLTAVGWPNPVIHFAARAFRADQEAACDASLLPYIQGEAPAQRYAQTLLHVATSDAAQNATTPTSTKQRRLMTEPALGLTLTHPLKDRLMMLKSSQKSRRAGTALAALLIAGGAMLTAPYVAAADPESEAVASDQQTETRQSKSVFRIKSDADGEKVDKEITIDIKDGNVMAWATDRVTGEKRELTPEELDAYNGTVVKRRYAYKRDGDDDWIMSNRPNFPNADLDGFLAPPPPMPSHMGTRARIDVAKSMISDVENSDESLSPLAKNKLAAARKALAEAEAALDGQ